MFWRKRADEIAEFAIALTREFSSRCPPAQTGGSARVATVASAIDQICNRAAEFQRARGLGVYAKAKFGTEFKMRMKELGYPADFVDELLRRMLISMSGK